MGAFLHGGVVPMIPNNENGVLEKKGFPTFLIPDVIAHVRGEDYYPQTTRSWAEKSLVVVDETVVRKFTYYWDLGGRSAYYVEEYNMEQKTKTAFTITPKYTEEFTERDLYYLITVLGKERAEAEFGLREIKTKEGVKYTFDPDMPTSAEKDFEIENGVLLKYTGRGGNVIIPNTVKEIASYAFENCNRFTRITLPDGIKSIGDRAFARCYYLAEIVIPDTVTAIGNNAFAGCSRLVKVNIPEGVTSIGDGAFDGCCHLAEVNLPKGLTRIENSTFGGCWELEHIDIPSGVTYIGDSAFSFCVRLTAVEMPDGVITLGARAFEECKRLASVKLSKSLTSIEKNTFLNCEALTKIRIPDSVTFVDKSAFDGCKNLDETHIPGSHTTVGKRDPLEYNYDDADSLPF